MKDRNPFDFIAIDNDKTIEAIQKLLQNHKPQKQNKFEIQDVNIKSNKEWEERAEIAEDLIKKIGYFLSTWVLHDDITSMLGPDKTQDSWEVVVAGRDLLIKLLDQTYGECISCPFIFECPDRELII